MIRMIKIMKFLGNIYRNSFENFANIDMKIVNVTLNVKLLKVPYSKDCNDCDFCKFVV